MARAEADARAWAGELGSVSWYSNETGAFHPVPAERISPSVISLSAIEGVSHIVQLGSCTSPHAVMSTVPLAKAQGTDGLSWLQPALATAPKWRVAVRPVMENDPADPIPSGEEKGEPIPDGQDPASSYTNSYDVVLDAEGQRQTLSLIVDMSGC